MAHNAEIEFAEFKEATTDTMGRVYRLNPRIGAVKEIHLAQVDQA